MTHEDIESTKAPLIDHLIELRSRLIRALIAFFVMFIISFFFAKPIYNILTWPYVWVVGPENSNFIYTGLLYYFIVLIMIVMFGSAFCEFMFFVGQFYIFVATRYYLLARPL